MLRRQKVRAPLRAGPPHACRATLGDPPHLATSISGPASDRDPLCGGRRRSALDQTPRAMTMIAVRMRVGWGVLLMSF